MKNRARILEKSYNQSRIFYKGKRAIYCAYDNGVITRTWKKSLIEDKCAIYLNNHNKAVIKCGGKHFVVKHLMAKLFIPYYKKGMSVVCEDGNELNCDINNLMVCTLRQLGKETGHLAHRNQKIKVTMPNGETLEFFSVRQATKELYCSYQTILDYMSGAVKNSILNNYKIERVI